MRITVRMTPRLPTKRKPGWSASPAPSREIMDWRAELWSISALARFVCEGAEVAGHPRLAHAGKSTVWRILNENDIKPHKIRYYLERRDPEFDRKMQEVLLVYRTFPSTPTALFMTGGRIRLLTVSVDEKPGVQALGLMAPDLPPVPARQRRSDATMSTFATEPCRSWRD